MVWKMKLAYVANMYFIILTCFSGSAVDKAVLLRTLARKLGTDWQQLAVTLRFGPADISQFESLVGSNPEEQAFQMLDSWWRKQADDTDDTWAGEWLKAALILIGRRDLAAMIPG